jgi:hypothetical protein
MSNKISKLLAQHIRMTHIPVKKTIHTIWCLEHSLGLNMPGVYCIPYDCDMVYVGQPNRSIQIRFKQHIRHLCLGQPGKSAVAGSIMETGHCRRFTETHTLSRTTGYMHHLLKKRPFRYYTQTNSTETEISCSTRPGNLHSGSYWLQLATNDVAAIFALHSLTPTGSLPPISQAIHDYINKAVGVQSHLISMMIETEPVSEMLACLNHLT